MARNPAPVQVIPFDLQEYKDQTYEIDTPWDMLTQYGSLTMEEGLEIVKWPATYRVGRSKRYGRYVSLPMTMEALFSRLPGPPSDEILLTACGYYDTPCASVKLATVNPVRQYMRDDLVISLFIKQMKDCGDKIPTFPPALMTETVVTTVMDDCPYATAVTLSRSNSYETQRLLRKYGHNMIADDPMCVTVMPTEIRENYNLGAFLQDIVTRQRKGQSPRNEAHVTKLLKLIPDKSVLSTALAKDIVSLYPSTLKTLTVYDLDHNRVLVSTCVQDHDSKSAARAIRSLNDKLLTDLLA